MTKETPTRFKGYVLFILVGTIFIVEILLSQLKMGGIASKVFFNEDEFTETYTNASFYDLAFEPLLSLYRSKAQDNLIPSLDHTPSFLLITKRSIKSKFWRYELEDIVKNRCPLPCTFTDNVEEANVVDAVVFYLAAMKSRTHFQDLIPKRNLSQPWIMLTFEAPPRANAFFHTKYDQFNGIFNRTASYLLESDIIIPYGAVFSYEDAALLPNQWSQRPYIKWNKTDSKMAAAFISNCHANSHRLEYIEELQKNIQVDIYGNCGTFKCGGRHYVEHGYNIHTDKCLKKIASEYLFFLSFENSICTDYVTEKLYNILHYQIVPIVMGGARYSELLPPHSYINALHYTPDELSKYLVRLSLNRTLYEEYFEWRKYYQASTWGGVSVLCHICARLHDPKFYKTSVIENFTNWFSDSSNCHHTWRSKVLA